MFGETGRGGRRNIAHHAATDSTVPWRLLCRHKKHGIYQKNMSLTRMDGVLQEEVCVR